VIDLMPPQFRLIAAALVAAACFGAGWTAQGWRMESDLADLKADHSETVTKAKSAERGALQDILNTERALRADLEGIAHDARTRAAAADAAAADLAGQHDRLRAYLAARRSAAGACAPGAAAGAAGGSPAGAPSDLVPGDWRDVMLDEAATALRALAPAVDDATRRSATCAAAYNAARERLRRYAEQGRSVAPSP
jgi:hypothetical protein